MEKKGTEGFNLHMGGSALGEPDLPSGSQQLIARVWEAQESGKDVTEALLEAARKVDTQPSELDGRRAIVYVLTRDILHKIRINQKVPLSNFFQINRVLEDMPVHERFDTTGLSIEDIPPYANM